MDEVNRQEIVQLRERSHEFGNAIQELRGWVEQSRERDSNINDKLDAIHVSLKEDIGELRGMQERGFEAVTKRQDVANGRLGEHDKEIAQAKGGMKVMALGLPVITGGLATVIAYVLIKVLSVGAS